MRWHQTFGARMLMSRTTQNAIPVIAAVTVNGVRNAEKKPLNMQRGSSHISRGYPHAAVTAKAENRT